MQIVRLLQLERIMPANVIRKNVCTIGIAADGELLITDELY